MMPNEVNQTFNLNEMEKDVIGEVMNISMGAAATAMSTILDKKVNITTPRIETLLIEEFEFSQLDPAMGVLIKYVEGISGTNVLLMKEEDLKKILGHLLSVDPAEMTEFDEISVSAICEIMNQMMGAAASALASFLGQAVNISPPEIVDLSKKEGVKSFFPLKGESLVSIKFN
ncbi:MAG: chemotaxis protein CheC, partial [Peptostreptococcaceae bacterium]|nr:chemotaxis protein CheC [Peptostreptococcaceae bacterium]